MNFENFHFVESEKLNDGNLRLVVTNPVAHRITEHLIDGCFTFGTQCIENTKEQNEYHFIIEGEAIKSLRNL